MAGRWSRRFKRPSTPDGTGLGEVTKLAEEIKTLRFQRWTGWMLFAISAVTAILTNLSTIKGLFVTAPRTTLAIRATDPFVRREGRATLRDSKGLAVATVGLDGNPVDVASGLYQLEVAVGDELVYESETYLVAGADRTIELPPDLVMRIRTVVSGMVSKVHSGQVLPLAIRASGAGHAWVFRSVEDDACVLAYPYHADATPVLPEENAIQPERELTLPTLRGNVAMSITAPTRRGPARLWVLVTSSPDLDLARSIIANYCELGITKASAVDIKENWGLQIVAFSVE